MDSSPLIPRRDSCISGSPEHRISATRDGFNFSSNLVFPWYERDDDSGEDEVNFYAMESMGPPQERGFEDASSPGSLQFSRVQLQNSLDEDEESGSITGNGSLEGRSSLKKAKKLGSAAKSNPIEISSGHNHRSSRDSNNRMSIFKAFTRRNSGVNNGKHKKLQDGWNHAKEPIYDGITFYVKFLGSSLIESSCPSDAADATKTVIQMVKAGQKPIRVGLTISTRGITLLDAASGELRLHISIYDIAHCSTDASFPNIFSFIATNKNEINECYCFASRKRKMARQITLTIAQSFQLAFELWKNSSLEPESQPNSLEENDDVQVDVIVGSSDSGKSCGSARASHHHPSQWVNFDDEEEAETDIDELTGKFTGVCLKDELSPIHERNEAFILANSGSNSRNSLRKRVSIGKSEDLLLFD